MREFAGENVLRAAIAMASLSWIGCSGPSPDGGPCGFVGGPNGGPTMSYTAILDDKQNLLVELAVGAKGECGTTSSFWLDASGNVTPRPAGAKPDYGAPVYDGKNGYSAVGQSVELVRLDASSVRVTFVNPSHAPLACSTPDGKSVSCK